LCCSYLVVSITGRTLLVVSGHGGEFIPEAGERNPTLHISRLGSSVKRWLRYIYDSVAPDYVIVCISDWDREAAAVLQDMEGVGMLITGSPEQESDGGDADGEIGDGAVLSPRITASKYETFNVPEDGRVSMYHHHHD